MISRRATQQWDLARWLFSRAIFLRDAIVCRNIVCSISIDWTSDAFHFPCPFGCLLIMIVLRWSLLACPLLFNACLPFDGRATPTSRNLINYRISVINYVCFARVAHLILPLEFVDVETKVFRIQVSSKMLKCLTTASCTLFIFFFFFYFQFIFLYFFFNN